MYKNGKQVVSLCTTEMENKCLFLQQTEKADNSIKNLSVLLFFNTVDPCH